MAIEATIKKWGNSFGILLPKDFIERQGLQENEVISVQVVKKADISKSFGAITRKLSGQDFKDMVKQGWQK
jgi:antitoxin component of MazEF toxin-antitoxin module